jgi:hypothetical protein
MLLLLLLLVAFSCRDLKLSDLFLEGRSGRLVERGLFFCTDLKLNISPLIFFSKEFLGAALFLVFFKSLESTSVLNSSSSRIFSCKICFFPKISSIPLSFFKKSSPFFYYFPYTLHFRKTKTPSIHRAL